ncbi:sulfotransferase domain-containing protein [Reichenbachiella agariperforans]|uniref:sulfotransferase domain-containing protein n=1 Tax=Reichenbachiella agariperforans TaxID=156994 RepID=UPI00147DEDAD|nr:sulfotransferase domain-containing protein [Reichenbachiella agariperforans]
MLLQVLRLFKTINPEQSILVFSDPRGGSTWLAELIHHLDQSIIYWEPLHPKHNSTIREIGFGWRQHIPKNAVWPQAKSAFDQILKLAPLNEWTSMRFSAIDYVKCQTPIIKFCRGNHLIHWLCQQYTFKYKPVVLLRHPFAVAASQLKQGGWDHAFSEFIIPQTKYNDIYLANQDFLKNLSTKEESLVATWCITNKDLLAPNSNWHTIYYESLITNPKEHIESLFLDWGMELPISIHQSFNKASATSVDLVENDSSKQLNKWQFYFDEGSLDNMQKVLDHFGINIYSKSSLYPSI